MKKYVHLEDQLAGTVHWNYCLQNQIPFITTRKKDRRFCCVEYDCSPALPFQKIEGLIDDFCSIYSSYANFFMLPKEKCRAAGGSNNFCFVVYKEHAVFVAVRLFDFLCSFIKSNKKALY